MLELVQAQKDPTVGETENKGKRVRRAGRRISFPSHFKVRIFSLANTVWVAVKSTLSPPLLYTNLL